MTDPAIIAARHQRTLKKVAEILERHDPELPESITNGRLPSARQSPGATALFHAEAMLSLARIVDEKLTPKKRGRPPKVAS